MQAHASPISSSQGRNEIVRLGMKRSALTKSTRSLQGTKPMSPQNKNLGPKLIGGVKTPDWNLRLNHFTWRLSNLHFKKFYDLNFGQLVRFSNWMIGWCFYLWACTFSGEQCFNQNLTLYEWILFTRNHQSHTIESFSLGFSSKDPSLVYFRRSRPAQAHKTRLETQTHYQTWSPAYERVRPPKISSTLKFFPKCRLLLTDGSLNHKLMVVFLIFTNHLHYILTRLPIKEIWLKLNTYQFPDLLSLVVNHTWYCPNSTKAIPLGIRFCNPYKHSISYLHHSSAIWIWYKL